MDSGTRWWDLADEKKESNRDTLLQQLDRCLSDWLRASKVMGLLFTESGYRTAPTYDSQLALAIMGHGGVEC